MARYAIKHKPTGKFFYEDEDGTFLVNEDNAFITFDKKSDADEMLSDMKKYADNVMIYADYWDDDIDISDDNLFPADEFEVATL